MPYAIPMMQSVRRAVAILSPVRARAKVLAREGRTMRSELVSIRRARGLSQQDVADRMGISQQAVHKLERYDADPRMSTIERYSNAVEALIFHRVEEDRGQSMRLAEGSDWESSPAIALHQVRRMSGPRTARVDGWMRERRHA